MEQKFHLVRMSGNQKLGGIPATTSSRSTCPDNCSLKGNGCYADNPPLAFHWDAVSSGQRGTDLTTHCGQIRDLPKHQLYRMWQAGDFPGDGLDMDPEAVRALVSANRGKHGFAYTHYDPRREDNAAMIGFANENGLTVNVSAETLEQADAYADLGVAPVVTLLPVDGTNTRTPAGRDVLVCPAVVNERMTCAKCGLCAVPTRKAIVGFPAHGSAAKKAQQVFFAAPVAA